MACFFKKLLSIVMILLLLFNVGGYYLIFFSLTYQTNKSLVQRFDFDDYSDDETITLKIPISLPYPIIADGFQRVNGEFDYNNSHYKLVKQKHENDTLYIVCYQDKKTKRILDAFSDFAKFSNDLPQSSKNTLTFMGKMISDYETSYQPGIIHYERFSLSASFAQLSFPLPDNYSNKFSPPPEQIG